MARPLRLEFSRAVYHVTSRGNASQDSALEVRDRRQVLTLLAPVVARYHSFFMTVCREIAEALAERKMTGIM